MDDPHRVLFVNTAGLLGGAEHSLLLLLDGLAAEGVECHVAVLEDGPFRERVADRGIPTTIVSIPERVRRVGRYGAGARRWSTLALLASGLPAVWSLMRLAKRERATILHTNGMKAHLIGGLAGRLAGVPVIWHMRDFPPPGWAGRVFQRQARRLPAVIFANSEAVRASIEPGRHGPPAITLHNPVDVDRFHPRNARGVVRRELGLDDQVPLVGMVAHLTPWKGHELFLTMARAVVDASPAARFVVVGGEYGTEGHAGYSAALLEKSAELGLTDRVSFLGARDDVADVMADLDVLVHCPTSPEPFGRVAAEAMAAGRPVVAARNGGLPEVVDDEVTGLLVPPDSADGFARAVLRLLGDAELRRRFAEAGRRRAETMFTPAVHAAAVLDGYRRVMSARRTGRDTGI